MLRYIRFILILMAGLVLVACSKKEEPEEPAPKQSLKRTVLVYAVASNNLYGSALDDVKEMLIGAASVNLDECTLMLYMVAPQTSGSQNGVSDSDFATLRELVRGQTGKPEFVEVKRYSRDTFSTDPARLSEVISDVREFRKADDYGLILWSHGTGWSNEDVVHPATKPDDVPRVNKSFGMDKYDGKTDYMNIDELAEAIPSGLFDFIWFDACYMCGIETVYQLKDKCDYFVGYPTEVWSPGMPYDQTLPLLLKPVPNLVGAADIFADYYSERNDCYTIAVLRTDRLEEIAGTARVIYNSTCAPAASSLLKYSRNPCGPFYDFRQFSLGFEIEGELQDESTEESEDGRGESPAEISEELQHLAEAKDKLKLLLEESTLYKSASPYNFLYPGYGVLREEYLIPAEHYSGINCHYFSSAETLADFNEYYRTLAWYKDAIAPR